MTNEITLETIKEELDKMEDKIIKGRQARKNTYDHTYAYKLYEIRVDKNREDEREMTSEERKKTYKERFEEVINQHQINIEDTLDKGLGLVAIGAICDARKWQMELDNL